MTERPILFGGEMVRAILEGRKTQTRRIIKKDLSEHLPGCVEPSISYFQGAWGCKCCGAFHWTDSLKCPYGQPGDRLYVRETWQECPDGYLYRATDSYADPEEKISLGPDDEMVWRPSIFMPRKAARILLEVTEVRVQRLQDITEEDARAEGAGQIGVETGRINAMSQPEEIGSYILGFMELWESINGPGSWEANPWVWAITFKKVKP